MADAESKRTDTFTLVYEGEALGDGEMDVFDLAPALLAVGETFRAADAALNGSEMVVTTSVQANFQKGSFEIVFSIDQHLRNAAAGVLPAMHLIGADKLIAAVIGSTKDFLTDQAKEKGPKIVEGLFKLLGRLGGEEPERIQYDASARNSIFVVGNHNTFLVEQNTADLYQNREVRSAVSRTAAPLKKNGIKTLKAQKEKSIIASLEAQDFPELEVTPVPAPMAIAAERQNTQTVIVRILRTDFVADKWYVSEGGGKQYSVSMADEQFKQQVHARKIGFYDGDMYQVRMEVEQELKGKRLIAHRKIVRVLGPVPTQQRLPDETGRKFRES